MAEGRFEESLERVKAVHFDASGTECDYGALIGSREHGRLAAALADLESFDPGRVRIIGQTAFWINVFNAVVLRDAAEITLAASLRDLQGFFEAARVKISGAAYSLDDIEHGLLRGNLPKHGRLQAPMRRGDPRLEHMPLAYDERTHFAMYSASRSSPALRIFGAGRLDAQLEAATAEYLRRTVRVEEGGALIVLPRQFRWYPGDFGGERGALEFVSSRLGDDVAEAVDRLRGRVKLRYADFDWTLNRKTK